MREHGLTLYRGAYCAAVIISVLNLPLNLSTKSLACTTEEPTLYTGLAKYVQRCKFYFPFHPASADFFLLSAAALAIR